MDGRFLEHGTAVTALEWMTPLEQYLGPVLRAGRWWVRWVRVDPTHAGGGVRVTVTEDPLADPPGTPDLGDRPALPDHLRPWQSFVVTAEAQAPTGTVVSSVEGAALAWAHREFGAAEDRWVNESVGGWHELLRLRGSGLNRPGS